MLSNWRSQAAVTTVYTVYLTKELWQKQNIQIVPFPAVGTSVGKTTVLGIGQP